MLGNTNSDWQQQMRGEGRRCNDDQIIDPLDPSDFKKL